MKKILFLCLFLTTVSIIGYAQKNKPTNGNSNNSKNVKIDTIRIVKINKAADTLITNETLAKLKPQDRPQGFILIYEGSKTFIAPAKNGQ